jgi:hypothetical protein
MRTSQQSVSFALIVAFFSFNTATLATPLGPLHYFSDIATGTLQSCLKQPPVDDMLCLGCMAAVTKAMGRQSCMAR